MFTNPERRTARVAARAVALAVAVLACALAVNASAANITGSISGTVAGAGGTPISGAAVSVIGVSGGGDATTTADGSYTVGGLADGNYWVRVDPPPRPLGGPDTSNYVTQYYGGVAPGLGSAPVSVQGGGGTATIDVTLAAGGTISGVVTDGAGTPIQSATVGVIDADAGSPPGVVSAQTASDGSFTIDRLPAGDYAVEATGPFGANYLTGYFGGSAGLAGAFGVAVSAGSTSAGVELTLKPGGQITGTVTDGSNGPVAGEQVSAGEQSGDGFANTTTAADGTYDLAGLPTGTYRVEFDPEVPPPGVTGPVANYLAQFYDGIGSAADATPVSVTVGAVTQDIDAQLVAGGEIQGVVTDASKQPIAKATVTVYASDGTPVAGATTASDGTYTVTALPSATYKLGVSEPSGIPPPALPGYAPTFYGASTLAAATSISLSAGTAKTGIDMQQATGAVISGTVDDSLGNPLSDVMVTAYDAAGNAVSSVDDAPFTGVYSIGGLAAGTYRIDYAAFDGDYAPQSVTGVTVSAGASHSGVDVQMPPGGDIVGSVTTSSGAPVNGVTVLLSAADGSPVGSTTTSSDGSFDIPDLASGTYSIGFASPLGQALIDPTFYGGPTLAAATPVSVSEGAKTTVANTTLTLVTGAVSGVVIDASGDPLAGATVIVYDTNGNVVRSSTTAAADGSYWIGALAPGFYRIGFSRGGYIGQMYSDASSFSASQAFYVAAAQTASGIGAALAPAPPAPGGANQPPSAQQPNTENVTLPSVSLGRWLLLVATTPAKLAHGRAFSVPLTCLFSECDVRATASITRHRHRVVVAVGAINLHSVSSGRITLRLRPVGIKVFRRDHGRMRVTVRVAIGVSGAPNMSDSESVLVV